LGDFIQLWSVSWIKTPSRFSFCGQKQKRRGAVSRLQNKNMTNEFIQSRGLTPKQKKEIEQMAQELVDNLNKNVGEEKGKKVPQLKD